MSDKKRLWVDDISNADPAEIEDMNRHPTGATAVWGMGMIAFWVIVGIVLYLVLS